MYYCHCGTCRKASGSSFATNLLVLADDFELVSGRELLSAFESSPDKHRYFCSGCGSPVYSQAKATRAIVSVRGGTLEADPSLRPSVHAHVASKAPWFEIGDGLRQALGDFS
jgi:hypothetical protein